MAGFSAIVKIWKHVQCEQALRLSEAQCEAASFFDTRSTLSSSWGALVALSS